MEAKSVNFKQARGIKSAFLVIVCCFILALCIFNFVLGAPENFMNNDPNNHPLPGNMLGTIYKGGVIVPVLQTLLLTVLVLSIERAFAIGKAKGKGNVVKFVKNVKEALNAGEVEKATRELCVKQKGSVASVVYSALTKYAEMEKDTTLAKDQKLMNIQKELDEATALELPSLEQNLVVIATMTTLGTLTGLLGTVHGYDQVVCRSGQRRFSRLRGSVYRYFRGPYQHRLRYRNRCSGRYFLQLFHQQNRQTYL